MSSKYKWLHIAFVSIIILIFITTYNLHVFKMEHFAVNDYQQCNDFVKEFKSNWLEQRSNNELLFEADLQKKIEDAEISGMQSTLEIVQYLLSQLKVIRYELRKQAWALLQGSRKTGDDNSPIHNACTFNPHSMQLFDIDGNRCSISTNIGIKTVVSDELLQPTIPNKIFSYNNTPTCFISLPDMMKLKKRKTLRRVLDILDAVGEKINEPLAKEINTIIQKIYEIVAKTDETRNKIIPASTVDRNTSSQVNESAKTSLRNTQNENDNVTKYNNSLQETNIKLQDEYDNSVEIYEECFKQGLRRVLNAGVHVFDGNNNKKLRQISSIYFNPNKVHVVLYNMDGKAVVLRDSIDCLVNVQNLNFNNYVQKIEVRTQNSPLDRNQVIINRGYPQTAIDNKNINANLTAVGGMTSSHNRNQQWTYDGQKRIVSSHSGKCLDAKYGSRENGTELIQYDCHNGNNQKFTFQPDGSILNVNANKCIELKSGFPNATNVPMYLNTCDSENPYQQWDVLNPGKSIVNTQKAFRQSLMNF